MDTPPRQNGHTNNNLRGALKTLHLPECAPTPEEIAAIAADAACDAVMEKARRSETVEP